MFPTPPEVLLKILHRASYNALTGISSFLNAIKAIEISILFTGHDLKYSAYLESFVDQMTEG